MTKLQLALARVTALRTLPQYTSADCVEIVRVAMGLTYDEADWIAGQLDSMIAHIEAYAKAYRVSLEKAGYDVISESIDPPTATDAFYDSRS